MVKYTMDEVTLHKEWMWRNLVKARSDKLWQEYVDEQD